VNTYGVLRDGGSSGGGGGGGVSNGGQKKPAALQSLAVPLRLNQQQVLSNLLRVRDMVASSRARLDQQRVNEFLNACSEGNWHRIKTVSGRPRPGRYNSVITVSIPSDFNV